MAEILISESLWNRMNDEGKKKVEELIRSQKHVLKVGGGGPQPWPAGYTAQDCVNECNRMADLIYKACMEHSTEKQYCAPMANEYLLGCIRGCHVDR